MTCEQDAVVPKAGIKKLLDALTKFEAGAPAPLFEFRAGGNLITPYYCVTSDGNKFLLNTIVNTGTASPLTVVVNWMTYMKRD